MPRVTGLFLYPVKSLRGFSVPAVELDALGFVGDRRFLVVDAAGKFLTQRTLPAMAQIDTRLAPGTLTLSAERSGAVTVSSASDPAAALYPVSIWKSEGLLAEDCGADAARWLSRFLGLDCRLVRIGARFRRPVLKAAARTGDVVSFADAVPVLVANESSLADLNDRLAERGEEPVPMDRFRPNLVIAGAPPFAEDAWPRLAIRSGSAGDAAPLGAPKPPGAGGPPRSSRAGGAPAPTAGVIFRSAGPSARCIMTTTDQHTGERLGPEPLRTLATYRRSATDPTNVNFGINLIPETTSGVIRVGDTVEPLPA